MNEYLDLGLITSFVPAASSFAGDIDFLFDLEESIFNLVRTILEENADISEGLVVSQFQSILAELENTKITQNPPATDLEGVPENSKQEASLDTEISNRDSEKPKIKSESLIPADLKQSLHLLPDVRVPYWSEYSLNPFVRGSI